MNIGRVENLDPFLAADVIRRGNDFSDLTPGAWVGQAKCVGADPELFHPGKGEGEKVRDAKGICGGCPVQAECLAFALIVDDRNGVWGGKSAQEREKLDTLAVPGRPGVVVRLRTLTETWRAKIAVQDAVIARKLARGATPTELAQVYDKDPDSITAARKRHEKRVRNRAAASVGVAA